MRVAYLCNSFPEPSESYVGEEIRELTRHGITVLPCGVRRSKHIEADLPEEAIWLFPLRLTTCVLATWLCVWRLGRIRDLLWRAVRGPEPVPRRLRTVLHTWLGAYFAARVRGQELEHIHVHHGYFAAWVGMVAARLLDASFSMTLHGSDLLVRADYLDVKLKDCKFCLTVSEFNRRYILECYPKTDPKKIVVQRLGVDPQYWTPRAVAKEAKTLQILSVGRLHPVKNHAFLILACQALKSSGIQLRCTIAGDGAERPRLEELILHLGLGREIRLMGHVPRERLPDLYAGADVVVLTSHSEGIPITLMEAMAMQRVVLAPEITGIPELVAHGKTGFLYRPGDMEGFLVQLQIVLHAKCALGKVRRAAREHVLEHFNSRDNLVRFANTFLSQLQIQQEPLATATGPAIHENPVLQQI